MNPLKIITYARASVYQEAYIAETRSGGSSTAIAAFLVGIFDAPLIMAVLLILDSLFFNGSAIREGFSSNLTSLFSVAFTLLVLSFEYVYYCVLKVGLRRGYSSQSSRVVGVTYAVISLIGGGVLIYLVW